MSVLPIAPAACHERAMAWAWGTLTALVAVAVAGAVFLRAADQFPWPLFLAAAVPMLILLGFIARRNRGTRTTSAAPPQKLPKT